MSLGTDQAAEEEEEEEEVEEEEDDILTIKQAAQTSEVKAKTNNIRGKVRATMLKLKMTQKTLSSKLGITPVKISQWLNKHKVAEPEMILVQMMSFLEEEEDNARKRTNIGSSSQHAALPGTIDARRAAPSVTGTSITTPPTATRTAPNAPDLRTESKSLNNEPDLKGGFAFGRKGQTTDQVNINQDINAMPDDGKMQI